MLCPSNMKAGENFYLRNVSTLGECYLPFLITSPCREEEEGFLGFSTRRVVTSLVGKTFLLSPFGPGILNSLRQILFSNDSCSVVYLQGGEVFIAPCSLVSFSGDLSLNTDNTEALEVEARFRIQTRFYRGSETLMDFSGLQKG